MSQQFTLHKDDSRITVIANLIRFIQLLSADKSWKIVISVFRKTRSIEQNAALFGVAYTPMVEYTGYTKDELHWWMCCNFFGTRTLDINGVSQTRPMRTTTTDEQGKSDVLDWFVFSEFYANVQRVGAEAGVWIPDPDPALSKRWKQAA